MSEMGLKVIGRVGSPLKRQSDAPCQGDEGAPLASIELREELREALDGITPGDELFVITWLHEARRDVLRLHPRGDRARPLTGVFATRSPDRPNPIGLHRVRVTAIAGCRLEVEHLEAIDGTPVVDIKPVLSADGAAR